jgi:hypothetical protein
MLGRNRDPQSNFYSGTISGGVGEISFDYMQAFSTNVNLNILINDVVVGNVTSDAEQNVVKSSGTIEVNTPGDIIIKFINQNNSDGQVVVDNVVWTPYEEPDPFTTLFEALPTYFGASTERGFAVDADNVYVASRNGGTFIRVHDRLTGAETGTLNTTGIAGGTFPINDMEVTEDGLVLAGNLGIGTASAFKVYIVDETADAVEFINYPLASLTNPRFGDKFTVVGSTLDGSAVVYAADGSNPLVLKFTMVPSVEKEGFEFGEPEIINLGVAHGSTPVVAPKPDGTFFYTASGHSVHYLDTDGSLIGTIPGSIVATSSTAMKYLGTDGNDDMLAIYQFGAGNENIRVVRIVDGDPALAEIEFVTTSLGSAANTNGTGDVAFIPRLDNNADLYVMGTNNGVGGYTSLTLNLEFPVYLPPADDQFARAQFIHNSADLAATSVDVFVNGELFYGDFDFRTATPFVDVPAEVELTIDIAPAGAGIGSSVFNTNVTLTADETYVIVANGIVSDTGYDPAPAFAIYPFAPAREVGENPAETDLLVFHGSTDAPEVSVWAMGGDAALFNFSYGEFTTDYLGLPTDDYVIEVRTADGSTVVAAYEAPLGTLNLEGAALTVVASGFLNPANNSDGPAFGLFVATAAGGALLELPLYEDEPLIGDSCDNPIIVDVIGDPLVDYEISSEPYPDLFESSWVDPSSSYMGGNNIVFQFTLESTSLVSGSIAGSWAGMVVTATCPDPDVPAAVLASGTGSTGGSFADVALEPGDYFMIVGTWPSPQFTDMTINLSAVEAPADPALVVVPDTLDVGFAVPGINTVSGSVLLSNEAVADVVIEESDITITGAQADRFSFALADTELSFPLNIGFEEVVELVVTFDPAVVGPAEAEMVIAWNNPEGTDEIVTLFGTGYEAFTEVFENFDEATPPDIPSPWTGILNVEGPAAFVDLRTVGSPYSAPHHVRLANGNNIVGDVMLVSPLVTDMNASWVRFFARMGVSSQVENLAVGYMTDLNDVGTFVPLDTLSIVGTYAQYVVSLADLAAEKEIVFPENGYIAFRHTMEVTYRVFYLDNIAYEPQPTTPVFSANADAIDFGDNVYIDQTVNQTLSISNAGTGILTINETDINITGADAAYFDVVFGDDMVWPIELATAEIYELTLSFTPDAVRDFVADLEIEDNIVGKAVNVIPLSGTGYDPTVTPPYLVDFIGDFPPLDWTRWAGELNDTTELSPVSGFWNHSKFANQADLPENNATKINIYGTSRNHWFIPPPIDLGDGTVDYMLNFDVALTGWNNTNPATFGPNQYFAVVISTDGETWVPANILQLWDAEDEISNTGEPVTLDLSEYSGSVQIGFYGESRAGGGDVDLHVTNVHVREIEFFNVTFNVADSEGTPITDATVMLGDQTLSAAPYLFEDVLVGDYDYEVSKLGYIPVSGNVSVVDQDVVVDVVLLDAFTVDFTVTDGTNPISDANIDIFDDTDMQITTLVTDVDGEASILLADGVYTFDVFAVGFDLLEDQTFTVVDQDITVSVVLTGPDPMTLPFAENFNDTILPMDWIVVDLPDHATPDSWQFIGALDANTLDGTAFTIIDSDAAGSGAGVMNSILYTPAIDASVFDGVLTLSFEQYYRHLGDNAFGKVEVWDGSAWILLAEYTETQGSWDEPDMPMFDISEYANADLRVRFHYTDGGAWAWYWAIDNVEIKGMLEPVDPLEMATFLDATGDNLPAQIGEGGNARAAALYQDRYVVVPSREGGTDVWVWDALSPHLEPFALNKGDGIIQFGLFEVNYAQAVGDNIYVSNMTLGSNEAHPFRVYRWSSLDAEPEVILSSGGEWGRLGDAFSIIGDPATEGSIIAHVNSGGEGQRTFRKFDFVDGVIQNEDTPELITLEGDYNLNSFGTYNPIEGEDDLFLVTGNGMGIAIANLAGEVQAYIGSDVVPVRTLDPQIFTYDGKRYLSYVINNEGNSEDGAYYEVIDISMGADDVDAFSMITTTEILNSLKAHTFTLGAGAAFLSGTNRVSHTDDGEIMILSHVVARGFVLETTGTLPATYALTVVAEPAEGGTVEGGGDYYEGAMVPVSAVAAGGYEFVNWTVGGTEVSTEAEFNYTMPGEATTLTANFEALVIEDIATLAELRTKPADGTLYRYTGDAVITAMDGFRNRKFLEDATAAIMIDDNDGIITPEYDLYDVITNVTGEIVIFRDMVQFKPAEDTEPATENTPVDPTVFMLDEVTQEDQAKFIQFMNVTFMNLEEGDVFENGTNYTVTDGVNEFVIRTDFWDVDYIGEEIPTVAVNISGVVITFFETLQLVPRFAADIEEYTAPEVYNVTFNVDMTPAEGFDPENDVVYITGSMFGWAEPGTQPDDQTMTRVDDSMIWTKTLVLEAGTYQYKYFLNAGWDGGEWEGEPNREVVVAGDMVVDNVWRDLVNVDDFNAAQINVFPNPARDNFNITAGSMIRSIVIADITGKVVYNDIINDTQTRIYNAFETGIYIVHIYTEEGVFVRKLQIQK